MEKDEEEMLQGGGSKWEGRIFKEWTFKKKHIRKEIFFSKPNRELEKKDKEKNRKNRRNCEERKVTPDCQIFQKKKIRTSVTSFHRRF